MLSYYQRGCPFDQLKGTNSNNRVLDSQSSQCRELMREGDASELGGANLHEQYKVLTWERQVPKIRTQSH